MVVWLFAGRLDLIPPLAVAQARLRAAPLLTKDRTIQDHYDDAAWDLDRA